MRVFGRPLALAMLLALMCGCQAPQIAPVDNTAGGGGGNVPPIGITYGVAPATSPAPLPTAALPTTGLPTAAPTTLASPITGPGAGGGAPGAAPAHVAT